MGALLARYPSLSYVLPFAVFMTMLAVSGSLPGPPRAQALIRVGVVTAVILAIARGTFSLRLTRPVATIGVGILVFVVWILPDQIAPGYRSGPLFENSLLGKFESTVPPEARADPVFLALRMFRAVLLVPIVEELFWRGWLPRWIDRMEDFRERPLGSYTAFSFGATAVLFAVEHGSLWDVGLVAGVIYNWWMIKTKSLGDLIACHGVTNGCLSGWVLTTGQWRYW